ADLPWPEALTHEARIRTALVEQIVGKLGVPDEEHLSALKELEWACLPLDNGAAFLIPASTLYYPGMNGGYVSIVGVVYDKNGRRMFTVHAIAARMWQEDGKDEWLAELIRCVARPLARAEAAKDRD
ncbi:MAG: hypothetical protein AAFU70_05500, partial [Planctomycetota bacterium]